jgi:hypothetical protein
VSKIAWRVDLSRTAKGLTAGFHELLEWRVKHVSLRDGINPAGRLMSPIFISEAHLHISARGDVHKP